MYPIRTFIESPAALFSEDLLQPKVNKRTVKAAMVFPEFNIPSMRGVRNTSSMCLFGLDNGNDFSLWELCQEGITA
jgi:hypothetical protein